MGSQFYLPLIIDDFPAVVPAEAGTQVIDPGGTCLPLQVGVNILLKIILQRLAFGYVLLFVTDSFLRKLLA